MVDQEPVHEAVRAYAAMQPGLTAVTGRYVDLIRTLLDDAGIDYLSVDGRTKSVASFAAKAHRTRDGSVLYPDPLEQITDVVGVRVITYVQSDVAAVAELLDDEFTVLDDRDLGEETARAGRFGYASRHLLVRVDRPDSHLNGATSFDVPAGLPHGSELSQRVSVQLRTVLQHAWAEFEHDIRYKGTVPEEAAPDLDRRFTLAAGLIELADREFATIRARIQEAAPTGPGAAEQVTSGTGAETAGDDEVAGQELAQFLAGHYSEAGWSHTDHYGWIAGLLRELGITSLDELDALLTSVDADAIIARMGYKYPAGAVRRLDDALLAIFGEQYVTLEGNSHRVPRLRERLDRLTAAQG
ncbi:GTP pyrophosphokinase [Nocardioides seonyuensis]|uniref:GTP pyrophosphokinase n=1 Tax=Nocardioides seonyuensis TaxID=2518371 RepID=A0A4P7IFV1_9ACTN|nr:GTP pyrophosphokinase [Nocardioides seonyuensis]QBX56126.1 GTP pyrophosphokinase [Nocardioides seonyuensis]